MTIKSFNRRYTKLIRKMAAACGGLLLLAVCLSGLTNGRAGAAGFDHRPAQDADSTPALHGAEAIANLKERGLYESLRAALSAAGNRRGDYSVISPSLLDERKLTASDGAFGDQFGQSIAVSGSTIVVGAPLKVIGGNFFQGAAYVFEYLDGSWVEVQKLTASDGARSDQFGQSIAVSGSTIVVGAPLKVIGGNFFQGAAYVFEYLDGSWVETQKLTAGDGAASDSFGWSVAVSGSTIVVGALSSAIGGNINQGSAYVFERQGGSWVETRKLTASDGEAADYFGYSAAISGSTIVVGAFRDDIGGNLDQGSAYIFERRGGSWVEARKLTAGDNNRFGYSVSVSGSTIAVGTQGGQGAAYVFSRQGGSWVETQKLTTSDGTAFGSFGWLVAVSGSTIVVSAHGSAIGDNINQGSAHVFSRQDGGWVETRKLTASDGAAADFFSYSVAISGSTIAVGAIGDDIDSNTNQGSAYVFQP